MKAKANSTLKKKVVYDPAPAPDVVLYGAYFAVVGTIGLGLAYGSSTLNDFVSSGFSFNSLKESIDNFHWNRGVTHGSTLTFLAAVHIVYIILLQLVQAYSNQRKTIPGWVPATRKAHNVFLAGLSAFMLVALVVGGIMDNRFSSFYRFGCQREVENQNGLTVWAMYIFYLSKMLEFIDTFFLIISKKKVILLHKVHHLTTMSLVWHSLETDLPSDILCGGLNCAVHTLMYAYYAFPDGNRWLRQYMTSSQILQFVFCLIGLVYAQIQRVLGSPCMGTSAAEWHGVIMYGVYLGMFMMFFYDNYCRKGKKNKSKKAQAEAKIEESKKEKHEVILHGKRVDVTNFLNKHPGGRKVLFIFRDRDATEQFEAYHSTRAKKWLKALPKREVLKTDFLISETKMAKDFAKMVNMFKEKGFYRPHLIEEIVKVLMVFGPYIVGHYLLFNGSPLAAAFLMGFGLYYGGWVSHDYLHHAVIKGGKKGDETTGAVVPINNVMGYVIGFMQGYEVDWWRARHNTHHVVTNEDGNDPDIKTAPVLVFVRNSPTIAKGLNMIQRWQQYYYLPVMCILDFYWRLESIAYILIRMPKYYKQFALMLGHIIWTAYAFYGNYRYLVIMSLFRGFLTGTIVFSTHYGEDILDKNHNMTLVEQTSKTSRNITGGYIADLLTGFISLQTEHHLFPMMPTANLAKARPYVMKFFKEHGLEYREGNIIECVRYNIRALRYDHVLHG
uniref:Cytochrome b5 heme-binding domain-containing protein n=1 Tax=Amorphochlora amoebiformis TaxID=1561963 RepID=A0A7S0DJH6_9EUKA